MKRIMLLIPLSMYGDTLDFMDQSRPIVDVIPPLTQEYVPPFKEPKTFYITYHKKGNEQGQVTPAKMLIKKQDIPLSLTNKTSFDASVAIVIDNHPDASLSNIILPAGSTKVVRIPYYYWLVKPSSQETKPSLIKDGGGKIIMHVPSQGSVARIIDSTHLHIELIVDADQRIDLIAY